MPYTIEYATSALRELRSLDREVQQRIQTKIESLAENPLPSGIKKFQGASDHWRIRIGDYRVIYRIDRKRIAVVIVPVAHRREVYR